jgi:hypothetical protein
MKLKIILDEDIHYGLAPALRNRGYNVIHIQELNRKGMTDKEQIDYAVQHEMCFFTFNVKDFVILHNEYVQNGREHWGIIVSKQLSFKDALHRVLPKLQLWSKETMKNRLVFL